MREAGEKVGSANIRPKVIIPCPVQEGDYAGWEIQLARFVERNDDELEFCLIHSKTSLHRRSLLGGAFTALVYAFDCRRQILAQSGPIVVLFPVFFLANVLLSLLLPRKIPRVVRISGNELGQGSRLGYALRLREIRLAQRVIALNTADFVRLGNLAISAKCSALIPNPVGLNFQRPNRLDRVRSRQALGISARQIAIGCVGTICSRKRQRLLIAAASALGRSDIVVVLCGPNDGSAESDLAYAAACRADASRAELTLIMTGQRENVRDVLWALDMFVLPSVQEGMPNSLLEALACGVPSIGSDIPGIKDVLTDSGAGTIFPVDDVQALTEELTQYLEQRSGAGPSVELLIDPVSKFRPKVIDKLIRSVILDATSDCNQKM